VCLLANRLLLLPLGCDVARPQFSDVDACVDGQDDDEDDCNEDEDDAGGCGSSVHVDNNIETLLIGY